MRDTMLIDALLLRMQQEGARLSVRSITRRLAEAGLRVRTWRRASRPEVLAAWATGQVVIVPNRSRSSCGVGEGTKWDVTSFKAGCVHKLERLRVELLLLDWTPRGTAIICDL